MNKEDSKDNTECDIKEDKWIILVKEEETQTNTAMTTS